MGGKFMIREATSNDYTALGQVMFDAVRTGPSRYTQQQRAAWVPVPRSGEPWDSRLAAQTIFLAEGEGGVQGFMSIDDQGYIDLAFIIPAFQGSGLFRQLLGAVLAKARQMGVTKLETHASLMAQPAFSAMGFEIAEQQTVEIGSEKFDRFAMMMKLEA
jgi:putative acetyltransferase